MIPKEGFLGATPLLPGFSWTPPPRYFLETHPLGVGGFFSGITKFSKNMYVKYCIISCVQVHKVSEVMHKINLESTLGTH